MTKYCNCLQVYFIVSRFQIYSEDKTQMLLLKYSFLKLKFIQYLLTQIIPCKYASKIKHTRQEITMYS